MASDDTLKRAVAVGLCQLVSRDENGDPVDFVADWLRSCQGESVDTTEHRKTDLSECFDERNGGFSNLLINLRASTSMADSDLVRYLHEAHQAVSGLSWASIIQFETSTNEGSSVSLISRACAPAECENVRYLNIIIVFRHRFRFPPS